MNNTKQKEIASFDGLGIAPKLLEILSDLGYMVPTPIQSQSIPVALERKDMVGIAQTGTGKTLAFGIPMLQLLAIHKGKGLVLLPTRELAMQVDENLKDIGKKIGLRTAVLIGGQPIKKQLASLRRKPHIIIATPGRLVDHAQRKSVNLMDVRVLVLDEADMMLDMGFLPQIRAILKLVSKQRQTMLFSATMPSQIIRIASDYMSMPTRIEVAPAGTSAENVEQEIIVVEKAYKIDYLRDILSKTKGSVLIFMRTKHAVKTLTRKLNNFGFNAAEIHSNRSLGQRREALEGFKIGKYKILIATDIAARGIDVKEIELVINYDLPEKTGDYVHRIGRTARAGKSGKAISFVMPSQISTIKKIERLINKTINTNKTEEELREIARTVPAERKGNNRGRRPNRRRK
jgi:ATP-dependent RNA helicase RhlE